MSLPAPRRTRWQPLRSGLVNLYRYDEQEFHYEDGRLLLRGNNGTGKSRVLALQLPFLLDGEAASARVEPDGDIAKRLSWNLLMDRYDERRGYTWIEFGRRDNEGVEHYLTLGCCLHAVVGRSIPRRWFFLTNKRVGEDLSLVEGRMALSPERLRAVLGPEAELIEEPSRWRAKVDSALFGLRDRYDALLDLLIQLRQPQLSRQLDENRLSAALSTALSPLPARIASTLAEAFRALESDRSELLTFREAASAAEDFLRRYRRYTSVASRRRAADLRGAHAAHEAAGRALKAASVALELAKAARVNADREEEQARGAFEDADVAVRTLEAAPEMNLARELDRAQGTLSAAIKAVERAEMGAAEAGRRAERAEAERTAAAEVRHARRIEAEAALAALVQAAEPVGLEAGLDALETLDTRAWNTAFEAKERGRRRLETSEEALSRATRQREAAEAELHRQRAALDRAHEAEAAARRAHREASDGLCTSWAAWCSGLRHLEISDAGGVESALEAWCEEARGTSPLQGAVDLALATALSGLATREAELGQQQGSALAERRGLEEEADRLRAGVHAPPPSPATRDPRARDGQPGAPLWRLCDFRPEVDAATRRGVEAALEAAGLLDAWVFPDGGCFPTGAADAALTLAVPPVEPNLSRWLVALEGAEVPPATTEAVLARIGAGHHAVSVQETGRYTLGLLVGSATKAEAEHIGETARAEARRRRLAEILGLVAELDVTLAHLDESLAALRAERAEASAEARRRPDEGAVRTAAAARASAGAEVLRAQSLLIERESASREALLKEKTARTDRDQLAGDLGLSAWCGRLRALGEALADARVAATALWPATRASSEAEATTAAAARRAEEAAADLEAARAGAEQAERGRRDAEVRRDTLQRAHGAEVEVLLTRLAEARQLRAGAELRRKSSGVTARNAFGAQERATEALGGAETRAQEEEARRAVASAALERLVSAGFLDVVGLPPPEGAWNPTRAIETARALEEHLTSTNMDDGAWARVQDALLRDIEELRRALLPHRLDPVVHTDDSLLVVEIPFQDRPCRVPELHARLHGEVLTRESLLSAREREVLENHLVGDVATLLHGLIHNGEALVREMSREVEARHTSTGMRLRFAWELRGDASPALVEARRRLLRQGATWGPADREQLAHFLKERLDEQRQTDPAGTWQQHIEAAFDYRAWHTFRVERSQDGQWKPLTRRTHGTGSGGEKALALTIPQLAAAAAFYRNASPTAPRLILLDEAFVGIDNDMRAKCMGLLSAFDLDFLMTSEREWGCYATLPGVAIYQLVTRPGFDAIDAVRWVWNGRERRRVDASEPLLEGR